MSRLKAPAHWLEAPDAPGLTTRTLSPLGAVYAALTARRVARTGARASVPVICVGNLNAGGTGKTPTVVALIDKLSALGLAPHILSRGYGGRLKGPVRVSARHRSDEVGDEALFLSQFAPTWVAHDRAAGAEAAVGSGAQALILDDGFQDPALHKDLALVVVDAHVGFGNGRVIPAGPLREPVEGGLARADAILSIGPPSAQARFGALWGARLGQTERLTGELRPLMTGMPWLGLPVLAFAGIGFPEKFFATLDQLGARTLKAVPLGDHERLSEALMMRLEREARDLSAQLVTTEKDAARLPEAFRSKVLTLPVRLDVADWGRFGRAIERLAGGA